MRSFARRSAFHLRYLPICSLDNGVHFGHSALVTEPTVASEMERLTARLRAEGWADHVTVERLIHDWQQLANEVADYPMTIDDYTNDVTARDALDLVLNWASESTRTAIGPEVFDADQRFKESTADDGGESVSRYFRMDSDAGWWWHRRPTTGALAEYLDLHR